MAEENPKTVVTAVGADIVVALAKTAAAVLGGSAAMAAEALHSFIDATNQALLLIGQRRSAREPDASHPFGHGAEIYFWAVVVAGVIFAIGGGATIVEGIYRFEHPEPPHAIGWNLVVYAIALCADGYAFVVGVRELRRTYPNRPLWNAIRASKDPNVFVVVLEDGGALLGIAIAVAGTIVSGVMHDGRADAAASILIGVLLAAIAVTMLTEMSSLLTGESADPEIVDDITVAARGDGAIAEVRKVMTMTLGPDTILVAVDVAFVGRPSLDEATDAIRRLRDDVRSRRPMVRDVLVRLVAEEHDEPATSRA